MPNLKPCRRARAMPRSNSGIIDCSNSRACASVVSNGTTICQCTQVQPSPLTAGRLLRSRSIGVSPSLVRPLSPKRATISITGMICAASSACRISAKVALSTASFVPSSRPGNCSAAKPCCAPKSTSFSAGRQLLGKRRALKPIGISVA